MEPAKHAMNHPANTFDLMVCSTLKTRAHGGQPAARPTTRLELDWRKVATLVTSMNLEAGRLESSCPDARVIIVRSANEAAAQWRLDSPHRTM